MEDLLTYALKDRTDKSFDFKFFFFLVEKENSCVVMPDCKTTSTLIKAVLMCRF